MGYLWHRSYRSPKIAWIFSVKLMKDTQDHVFFLGWFGTCSNITTFTKNAFWLQVFFPPISILPQSFGMFGRPNGISKISHASESKQWSAVINNDGRKAAEVDIEIRDVIHKFIMDHGWWWWLSRFFSYQSLINQFRFINMLSPNSSGFLTLWFRFKSAGVIHVGKHVPASDLASSGAMWLPCGAVKAWVEPLVLLGAGCWFSLTYNLYQVPRWHPSIYISVTFFPLGFPVPVIFSLRGMLAPCDPLWHLPSSPTRHLECSRLGVGLNGLVAGGWWRHHSWKCHSPQLFFSLFLSGWKLSLTWRKITNNHKLNTLFYHGGRTMDLFCLRFLNQVQLHGLLHSMSCPEESHQTEEGAWLRFFLSKPKKSINQGST